MDEIASHFNEDFQNAVFSNTVKVKTWQGPYASPHGYHLVLVSNLSQGYTPSLEQVLPEVASDYHRSKLEELYQNAVEKIVEGYKVDIHNDLL